MWVPPDGVYLAVLTVIDRHCGIPIDTMWEPVKERTKPSDLAEPIRDDEARRFWEDCREHKDWPWFDEDSLAVAQVAVRAGTMTVERVVVRAGVEYFMRSGMWSLPGYEALALLFSCRTIEMAPTGGKLWIRATVPLWLRSE